MIHDEWLRYGTYVSVWGSLDFNDAPVSLELFARVQQYAFGYQPGNRNYDKLGQKHQTTIVRYGSHTEYRIMAGPALYKQIGHRHQLRFGAQAGWGFFTSPEIRTYIVTENDSISRVFSRRTISHMGAAYSLGYRYQFTPRLFAEANLNGCIIPYRPYTDAGGQADMEGKHFYYITRDASWGAGIGIML
jgi:hypothetical protein